MYVTNMSASDVIRFFSVVYYYSIVIQAPVYSKIYVCLLMKYLTSFMSNCKKYF